MGENELQTRTLTDADVEAITAALEKRLTDNFYKDIGRGVWAMAKKALILIVVSIAAYGALKGFK